MATKEFILNSLKEKKTEISKYGIRSVGLFGSHVQGNFSDNSDIDILIDFEPDKENFDNFIAVCELIEKTFQNQRIDIVTKNGLSPYIGPKILEEVEYV